jgi:hypothetical protein
MEKQLKDNESKINLSSIDILWNAIPDDAKSKMPFGIYEDVWAKHNQETKITENTSDGYHTFKDLYETRKAYNVALFNEWGGQKEFSIDTKGGRAKSISKTKYNVHKSWKHHDGELCFGGGWFIVVAILPNGQISNHYKAEDWDLFEIPEVEKALFEFDGHTTEDVINRLLKIKP